MDSKTKILIEVLVIGIILISGWWGWSNYIQKTSVDVISQQIMNKCKEEKKFIEEIRSDPDCLEGKKFRCVDGWSVTRYYDKRLISTTEFPETFLSSMPKEMREELEKATIAIYGKSSCSCENPISYQILIGDKLEETTCERFYEFIEDYNSSCNDCILKWSFGCC